LNAKSLRKEASLFYSFFLYVSFFLSSFTVSNFPSLSVSLSSVFLSFIIGTGNGDTSTRSGLLEAVTLAAQKGIIVVVLTQCFQGGVLLDKYSVGVALRASGVVSGK